MIRMPILLAAPCGAAAEAILLSTAIAKSDEATSGGRGRIESMIIGKVCQELRDEYKGYATLLKYWRDQAAHSKISSV
jgi:hypothetical protein